MRRFFAVTAVVGLCGVSAVQAQTPPSPQSPTPTGWAWRPSLFLLASADENTDPPVGAFQVSFEEPAFAGNLGAGLDGLLQAPTMRTSVGLFGLVRSPISSPDRAVYLAGRANWSWQPSATWRIGVRDSVKFQRQSELSAAGFQRNSVTANVEWRPLTSPFGLSVEIGDRRRSLPEVERLGFARQSLGVALFSSTATAAAEFGVGLHRYDAPTATGRRLTLSGEVARFGRVTTASLRYAFMTPKSDRSKPFAESHDQHGEFGDIDRGIFLEQLAFAGTDATIASEVFVLEPIETDSDDWDFGRKKHVLVGYLSRRFAGGSTLAGSARVQRRDGPNLLAPEGSVLGAPFVDTRLVTRLTYRYPLTPRFSIVAQGSVLRNTGNRPIVNFSRQLLGIGLQIQF